jgi:hypothetical protein
MATWLNLVRRFMRLCHHAFLIPLLLLPAMVWQVEASAAQLKLTWTDNSNNEDGFEIERRTATAFTRIAVVGVDINSYSDSNLTGGTKYCYRVRAFNTERYSDYSNEACATTSATLAVTQVGSGNVTSSPVGINCPADCSEAYVRGTIVTLMAIPVPGYSFAGWSDGTCNGTGLCMLTVDGETSVTATFTITSAPPPLSLTGLSANLVSPQPPGTSVTFTAMPTGGINPVEFKWWVFDGAVWSVGQDWGTSNSFVWTPTTSASYTIGVWARSSANTTDAPENNAVLIQTFIILRALLP